MHKAGMIMLLLTLTALSIVALYLWRPIHQELSYHSFADKRSIAAIPNFWNVITNFPFVIIGIYRLTAINKIRNYRLIYSTMFTGILLTGLGSGYYHLNPDNNTLVFDRIPMTIVFMSFLSLTIAQCISEQWGTILSWPLFVLGVGSVLWWQYTDDLRLYGFVQFYPVLFAPLIYLLFPTEESRQSWRTLRWVLLWYIIAKLFEHFDNEIFQITNFVSGHSLKHLSASLSCYYLVKMASFKTGLRT